MKRLKCFFGFLFLFFPKHFFHRFWSDLYHICVLCVCAVYNLMIYENGRLFYIFWYVKRWNAKINYGFRLNRKKIMEIEMEEQNVFAFLCTASSLLCLSISFCFLEPCFNQSDFTFKTLWLSVVHSINSIRSKFYSDCILYSFEFIVKPLSFRLSECSRSHQSPW